MKITIAKFSDIVRENRIDAGYHTAFADVKDRVEMLKNTLTAEKARDRLKDIALIDKAPLAVLSRTTQPINSRSIAAVEKEYPHLSLALMEMNASPAIERIQRELARNQEALAKLLQLQNSSPASSPIN